MANTTTKQTQYWWLYAAIALGLVGFVLLVTIPTIINQTIASEKQRYEECRVSARTDCKDSMVFRLIDIALIQSGAADLTKSAYQQEIKKLEGSGRSKQAIRTSDNAPLILKAEIVGKSPRSSDGFYAIQGATKAELHATVQGDAIKAVEAYLIPKGVETAGIPEKAGAFTKGEEDLYTTSVLIPNGFVGELEIRAKGTGEEMAQLYFDIVAE